jgi:MATE family multidrug resistance protein
MTASVLLVFLPVWYIFRDAGNQALWLAFMSFMVVRGAAMHTWYRHLLNTNAFGPAAGNGAGHP